MLLAGSPKNLSWKPGGHGAIEALLWLRVVFDVPLNLTKLEFESD